MLPKVPENTPKYAYGAVVLEKVGSVLNMLDVLGSKSPLRTVYPLNMEQANHVRKLCHHRINHAIWQGIIITWFFL